MLQRRYGEARERLILGNYPAAATGFMQLSADAQDKRPLLTFGLFSLAARTWQAAEHAKAVPLLERFVGTESAG